MNVRHLTIQMSNNSNVCGSGSIRPCRALPRPRSACTSTSTARFVSRAFDEALAAVGGSTPAWLVLISLKTRQLGNQRELADAIGIRGATLSPHHLNAMEDDGLVVRRRDPANRRVQQVELTAKGEAAFAAMRTPPRLRPAAAPRAVGRGGGGVQRVLDKLQANVAD